MDPGETPLLDLIGVATCVETLAVLELPGTERVCGLTQANTGPPASTVSERPCSPGRVLGTGAAQGMAKGGRTILHRSAPIRVIVIGIDAEEGWVS